MDTCLNLKHVKTCYLFLNSNESTSNVDRIPNKRDKISHIPRKMPAVSKRIQPKKLFTVGIRIFIIMSRTECTNNFTMN